MAGRGDPEAVDLADILDCFASLAMTAVEEETREGMGCQWGAISATSPAFVSVAKRVDDLNAAWRKMAHIAGGHPLEPSI